MIASSLCDGVPLSQGHNVINNDQLTNLTCHVNLPYAEPPVSKVHL